jgi:hypothetical protein
MGDDSRLVRLLDNIVDNAISFSPEGGLVEIVAAHAGAEVLVSVEDEGPRGSARGARGDLQPIPFGPAARGFRTAQRPRPRHRARHRNRAWRDRLKWATGMTGGPERGS